jgi:hypothetical protein
MVSPNDVFEGCRHDRSRLVRIGKHVRAGKTLYILLCTKCGFTVSTDELRRLRQAGRARPRAPYAHRCAGRRHNLGEALGLR